MEDQELRSLLERTHSLAADNNRMLRAIRRDQWWGFIAKIIFWAVIIIVPFYFLQSYLSALPSASQLQDVLKIYTTGQY
jgi:hypothetical protein